MRSRILLAGGLLLALGACADQPAPTEVAPGTASRAPAPGAENRAVLPSAEQRTDEGKRLDAEEYARDNGVSVEEALRRMELQRAIGELGARLEAQEEGTFAGLYVEHGAEFGAVALFTRDGAATLQRHVAGTGLAGVVRAADARFTLVQLARAQEAAARAVRAQGVELDSEIDLRGNRAMLYVLPHALARAERAVRALQLPAEVDVSAVPALPERAVTGTIVAGSHLRAWADGYYYTCTGGFTVRNINSGYRGIVTAAHCKNHQYVWDYTDYQWVEIWYQTGQMSGSLDVQWHTTPYVEDNWVYYGGDRYREIIGAVGRRYQSVGDWVCKYGVASGYACGYIRSKTAYGAFSGSNATFIRVHRDGVDLSEGGDSGGPWFSGNYAYGVMHSQYLDGSGDAGYMAINYIGKLDLRVLTN